MVINIKVIFKMVNLMVKVIIFIKMELFIKAIGLKVKKKVKVYCILKKVENLKVILKMISKKVLDFI